MVSSPCEPHAASIAVRGAAKSFQAAVLEEAFKFVPEGRLVARSDICVRP